MNKVKTKPFIYLVIASACLLILLTFIALYTHRNNRSNNSGVYGPGAVVPFFTVSSEYDYACNIKDCVKKDNTWVFNIDRVKIIANGDYSEYEKYGLTGEVFTDKRWISVNEEAVSEYLSATEQTQYLIINRHGDIDLIDKSVNKEKYGYCVMDDAEYFWKNYTENYGSGNDVPVVIKLDTQGDIKYIAELIPPNESQSATTYYNLAKNLPRSKHPKGYGKEMYREGAFVGLFAGSFPFDYDCYVQKYEKTDEDTGLLYVTPIEFVWEEDMEDRETYRLNDDDFYPTGYVIIDDTKESIGLKTNSDTRYLLINWRHDHALTDVSDNKSADSVYCVISDPEYFMSYFSGEYGDNYNHYPMFIVMDEDGYVKLVIEAFLM